MKKITFILLALISGTAFAQTFGVTSTETSPEAYTGAYNVQSEAAMASAEIVVPLTIDKKRDLSFGRIISTATGGTVTVYATDAVDREADASLDASGGTVSSASFNITGSSYSYSVEVTAEDLKYQGGEDADGNDDAMVLKPLKSFDSNTGAQTLYVGGELTVGQNQAAGTYEGSVTVTVSYE